MSYAHLLVAVDATEDRSALLDKAQSLASSFGARLSVLSVLPPPPVETLAADAGMGVPILAGLATDPGWSEELREQTRQSLRCSCAPLGITEADIHLVMDHVDHAIVDKAAALGADLIVVGHHHHRGWFARLLPHTDQNVVGKAACDVLVVSL